MIFSQKREHLDYQCHSLCSFCDTTRTRKYSKDPLCFSEKTSDKTNQMD